MDFTPEILRLFKADPPVISKIELVYPNGGRVKGSIKKLRHSPLRLIIQKDEPEKGESSRHKARFAHVSSMKFTLKDGTVLEM